MESCADSIDGIDKATESSSGEAEAGVIVNVLLGGRVCDLVLPEGQREGVAFRGGPEALKAWIQAGPYYLTYTYRDGVTSVTKMMHSSRSFMQTDKCPTAL